MAVPIAAPYLLPLDDDCPIGDKWRETHVQLSPNYIG
jgi:hypothetical protein